MKPPPGRAASVLLGLVKLAAVVGVAAGTGMAIGYGLSMLSDDEPPTLAADGTQTTERPATVTRARTATTPVRTTPVQTTTPLPTTPRTTATTPGTSPRLELDVRVLGAILRPAGTASGIRRNRSRVTMRVRAENRGPGPALLDLPRLHVVDKTMKPDSNALTPESQLGELAPGESRSVTLRFELSGDATANATRDRRARITFAGRSLPVRITIGSPVAASPN